MSDIVDLISDDDEDEVILPLSARLAHLSKPNQPEQKEVIELSERSSSGGTISTDKSDPVSFSESPSVDSAVLDKEPEPGPSFAPAILEHFDTEPPSYTSEASTSKWTAVRSVSETGAGEKGGEVPEKKRRIRRTPEEIEAQKRVAEDTKRNKELQAAQREMKKNEKAAEARKKWVDKEKQRDLKPGECLRLMTMVLDAKLMELKDLETLVQSKAQEAEFEYEFVNAQVPNSVYWKRLEKNYDEDGIDMGQAEGAKIVERELIVLLELGHLLTLVDGTLNPKYDQTPSTSASTLTDFVSKIQQSANMPKPRIFLVVIGVEKYYRHLTTLKHRADRATYLQGTGAQASAKKSASAKPKELRNINLILQRHQVFQALVQLQLCKNVPVFFQESVDSFVSLLSHFTKSIAEAPFKAARKESHQEFGYMSTVSGGGPGSKSRCGNLGPNGEGQRDIWKCQLIQIPGMSADIASAIIGQYTCLVQLLEAYSRCVSEHDQMSMLADINMRRGSGPIASKRRVGPKISERVYRMFYAGDPDLMFKDNA